jgi:hypothetical protein
VHLVLSTHSAGAPLHLFAVLRFRLQSERQKGCCSAGECAWIWPLGPKAWSRMASPDRKRARGIRIDRGLYRRSEHAQPRQSRRGDRRSPHGPTEIHSGATVGQWGRGDRESPRGDSDDADGVTQGRANHQPSREKIRTTTYPDVGRERTKRMNQ